MPLGIVAGRKEIMDLADPTFGLANGQHVLIGGGRVSGPIPPMLTGLAVMLHMEHNQDIICPALGKKDYACAQELNRRFNLGGSPLNVSGSGLFSVPVSRNQRVSR